MNIIKKTYFWAMLLAAAFALNGCENTTQLPTPRIIEATQPQLPTTIVTTSPEPEATGTPEPGEELSPQGSNPGNPYPISSNGFVLGSGGSAEDVMSTLELLAPNDVQLEILHYVAEIQRMGYDPEGFEYVPGLVPGISWSIVPRNLSTGSFWLPGISNPDGSNLLQASLHIFEYLNLPLGDDFFDLVPLLNPPGHQLARQMLIGDASGWFVIGAFEGGQLVAWFDTPFNAWRNVEESQAIEATAFDQILFSAMNEAINRQRKKFVMLDPDGVEITVDVVPPEVMEQGKWNWDLRSFVKQTERGTEVWRTLYGPVSELGSGEYEDNSRWLVVIDVLDLREDGFGLLTLEGEPEALSHAYAGKLPVTNLRFIVDKRDRWIAGLQHLWDEQLTWSHKEVKDYNELRAGMEGLWRNPEVFRPETPTELISRFSGVSFYIPYKFDLSFSKALAGLNINTPRHAFKTDAQAGRLILSIYTGPERVGGTDLTPWDISLSAVSWMQWVSREVGDYYLDLMVVDMNPMIASSYGREVGIEAAQEVFFEMSPSELNRVLFQDLPFLFTAD